MTVPPFALATVVSQDPDNYALMVALHGWGGGQMPALSVAVGTHGPRDAVRGGFPELPLPGQHGLVAFPREDLRNGIWICSTSPALNDASPHAPGGPGLSHGALYSGAWWQHGPDGTTVVQWPDGSTLLVGAVMPAPTRHTVDAQQVRQRTAYPLAQRVTHAPSAFPFLFTHPSGASLSVTAAGALTLRSAPGQPVSLQVSGGASVVLTGAGAIDLTDAGGAPVDIFAANVITTGNVVASGAITAGFGGADQIGLQTHRHGTGTPTATATIIPTAGT